MFRFGENINCINRESRNKEIIKGEKERSTNHGELYKK